MKECQMYGTIARIRPTGGDTAALRALLETWKREQRPKAPGAQDSYLFVPDSAGPIAFLIAIFDDEASYRANADSPAQHAWYLQMRALLDGDPDWMDGVFNPA
jgi:quinol monooxygenase YgiN